MRVLSTVVAAFLFVALVQGQDKAPVKQVRVTGTSEVKVVPDRAVLELGVEKQSPSASAAKQAADGVSRRLLAVLRDNGVAEKDVQTTFLSLQPQTVYIKHVRSTYFLAAQTVTVTVRDLSKLDSLLGALIKAGGNRIDSIRYETSDLRKYRDQAREFAVKAAREKGEALARALGQGIGKAESIEEVPDPSYFYNGSFNASLNVDGNAAEKTRGPSLAPGQQSITASVVVSFELI